MAKINLKDAIPGKVYLSLEIICVSGDNVTIKPTLKNDSGNDVWEFEEKILKEGWSLSYDLSEKPDFLLVDGSDEDED